MGVNLSSVCGNPEPRLSPAPVHHRHLCQECRIAWSRDKPIAGAHHLESMGYRQARPRRAFSFTICPGHLNIKVRISLAWWNLGHAWLLCPGLTPSQQGQASHIYTYLGLRVNVDPMCLSLVVMCTGPVLVLRPATGIVGGEMCLPISAPPNAWEPGTGGVRFRAHIREKSHVSAFPHLAQ